MKTARQALRFAKRQSHYQQIRDLLLGYTRQQWTRSQARLNRCLKKQRAYVKAYERDPGAS